MVLLDSNYCFQEVQKVLPKINLKLKMPDIESKNIKVKQPQNNLFCLKVKFRFVSILLRVLQLCNFYGLAATEDGKTENSFSNC